ncbi:MAG: O-methyltransferase [Candidatus Melainabacteria bacterium]|jgi:predicted O-methyltransferase YrrM|nr:O-methyltransferase [Candidatus Melainabacteria bacterium]
MSLERWTAVDEYYGKLLMPPDPQLESALKKSLAAELPAINVAANQGKMLMLLAKMQKAERILEIGTLGGYSTIWLARALPKGGKLITLEYEQKHADVAQENIKNAGLSDKIEVRVGSASDTLPELVNEKCPPFDLIFIDADKPGYSEYFKWAMQLSKVGTTIIADNVVRDGEVINPTSEDERVQGIRKFNEVVTAEKRFCATAIQTVGAKGYDGFMIGMVTD